MSGFAIGVLACIPVGFFFGLYMGKTWGRLPVLRPGAVVSFRGEQPGIELRIPVQSIQYDSGSLTVCLASERNLPTATMRGADQ